MSDYYCSTKRTKKLYSLLQDSHSKDLFWARLRYDLEPTLNNMLDLYRLSELPEKDATIKRLYECIDSMDRLRRENKLVLLYGAGMVGSNWAHFFLQAGHDFDGFCDRNHMAFPNGLLGKAVFSPEYLLQNCKDVHVVITVNSSRFHREVRQFLAENDFPQTHIIPMVYDPDLADIRAENGFFSNMDAILMKRPYYDFPDLFPAGMAMVDGGCYDGDDSLYFAQWCNDAYSKILAFEPDPQLYEKCRSNLANIKRAELLHAGLSSQSGTISFLSNGGMGGHIVETKGDVYASDANIKVESIEVKALDDLTANERIGFIKLDIEGAELDALHGAHKTIMRDKPFMALCVYHKPGDVLAIMDYIDSLNLGYRFLLRHYTMTQWDTVLYASVDM